MPSISAGPRGTRAGTFCMIGPEAWGGTSERLESTGSREISSARKGALEGAWFSLSAFCSAVMEVEVEQTNRCDERRHGPANHHGE